MKSGRHNWIAWTLVAIFSASGSFSGMPGILCLSGAGHSRIESSGTSCCNPDISSESDGAFESNNHEDTGCGDCNDIEVSNLLSTYRSVKRSHDFPPPPFTSISRLHSRDLIPVSFFGKRNILPSSSPTISQLVVSTTILIC